MKPVKEMTQIELAAFVQTYLREQGIQVTLSGGAAVAYYFENRYVSGDLDLVNDYSVRGKKIQKACWNWGSWKPGDTINIPNRNISLNFLPDH